jgi:clan AA aspartic protease (TIGR02281 family)
MHAARGTVVVLAALALAASPAPAANTAFPLERDDAGRMLAAVTVNDKGPYQFILDTGANRTVLAPRVASELGIALDSAPQRSVSGIGGAGRAPMVRISSLKAGALDRRDVSALIMSGYALEGADGIIGMDGLAGQRLLIDFERRSFETGPGGEPAPADFIVIPGVLRFGHLLEVPIEIDGVRVRAIIDTGSQSTIGNAALMERFAGAATNGQYGMTGVDGRTVASPRVLLRNVRLGALRMETISVHLGELPIVRGADAKELPAVHLGMDVLGATRAIAIDLARRELQVQLVETEQQAQRTALRS